MGDNSDIEWTDATWNPVRGCVKVSPGCKHCYAETFAERFRGVEGHAYEHGFDPRLVPAQLDQPLRWTKPRTIFVNSMSDLLGDFVPDSYLDQALATMMLAPHHTFQVLTKRGKRLPEYLGDRSLYARVLAAAREIRAKRPDLTRVGISDPTLHPAKWIWWGVSVEDRKYGLPRIEHLQKAPAAVRFLSIEPLLEDLGDLSGYLQAGRCRSIGPAPERFRCGLPKDHDGPHNALMESSAPWFGKGTIDWVIVGGESGPGAREMDPAWVRSIRDQCVKAGVPFFFKQWGGVRKKLKGRALDGRTWDEMPEVRQ